MLRWSNEPIIKTLLVFREPQHLLKYRWNFWKKWRKKKMHHALLSNNQSSALIVSKSFLYSPQGSFYNILMYFLKRYYILAIANKKRRALIRNTPKKWQNWAILLNKISYFFMKVIFIALNKTLWHLTTIKSHCKTFFEFLMIF